MKYIKMLGLAAVAAMAFMAVAAGSASATTICTNANGTSCYPNGTIIEATSGHTQLTAGFGTVTCTENRVEGEVTNAGGHPATVSGPIKKGGLVFNKCNGVVKVLNEGSLEIHSTGTTGNGTLTSKGAEVTVELFGIHCVYGSSSTGTHLGTLTGGSTPTIHIKATVELKSGGGFCNSTAVWEGTYTVHKPHAIYVH